MEKLKILDKEMDRTFSKNNPETDFQDVAFWLLLGTVIIVILIVIFLLCKIKQIRKENLFLVEREKLKKLI